MSNIIFERAMEKDIEEIAKVHVDGWKETYIGIIPDEYLSKISYESRKSHWKLLFGKEKVQAIVCKIENEIVGFVSYGKEQHGYEKYDGEMYALYLLKKAQGKGIGKKLFENGKIELKKLGYKKMLIWALSENKSCDFYLKMGGQKEYTSRRNFSGTVLEEQSFGWEL